MKIIKLQNIFALIRYFNYLRCVPGTIPDKKLCLVEAHLYGRKINAMMRICCLSGKAFVFIFKDRELF